MAIELVQSNKKTELTVPKIDVTQAIIEQEYNGDSENAMSGKAVNDALTPVYEHFDNAFEMIDDLNADFATHNNNIAELQEATEAHNTEIEDIQNNIVGLWDIALSTENDIATEYARNNEQQVQIDANTEAISKLGYKQLASVTLTEAAKQIAFTQTKNGESLTKYKDFFIFWIGKFTENKSSGEAFMCNGNDGVYYFAYNFPKKATTAMGGWFRIEEIYANPNSTIRLYHCLYPSQFIENVSVGSYNTQGLSGNNRAVNSDIACRNKGNTALPLSALRFGTPDSGAAMFDAGTMAVLFGRER